MSGRHDAGEADRRRFDLLHGVRGLLASWVVLFHLSLNTDWPEAPAVVRAIDRILRHGHLAVPLFLVLSGFLLSMPVVTEGDLRPGYFRRRAWRLLPPYYAAWAGMIAGLWVVRQALLLAGKQPMWTIDSFLEHGLRWDSVVPHLLLVNNCFQAAGGVLWAVACEVQIGIAFGLLLVPVWRGAGLAASVAVAFVLGGLGTLACEQGFYYHQPWLLPCFATGMVASQMAFGDGPRSRAARRWPWGPIVLGAGLVAWAGIGALEVWAVREYGPIVPTPYYGLPPRLRWIPDLLVSLPGSAACIWLVADLPRGAVGRALARVLGSKGLVALGVRAYGLYLTHLFVALVTVRAFINLRDRAGWHWVAVMGCGAAGSLLLAILFWRWIERPSMMAATRRVFDDTEAGRGRAGPADSGRPGG